MTTPWIPDNSALACFRENPEAFRLKYRHHLRPAMPEDTKSAGQAVHAALNVRRAGGDVEEMVRVARELRGAGGARRNADQVERVLRAYEARYPREAEPFRVTANETYIEVTFHGSGCVPGSGCADDPTTECLRFCGIQDSAIALLDDASEYVMDVKSTGAYLDEKWQRLMRLSDQMVGYVAMRRASGHRCDGFFVDGIRFNDYVPKKGPPIPNVDLERDFTRIGPIRVNDWQVERWKADVRYTLSQIRYLEQARGIDQPWPMYQNWPYGKVDEFEPFYETHPELHASTMKLFARQPWNPKEEAEKRAWRPATETIQLPHNSK